jgi:hypothetical protein
MNLVRRNANRTLDVSIGGRDEGRQRARRPFGPTVATSRPCMLLNLSNWCEKRAGGGSPRLRRRQNRE